MGIGPNQRQWLHELRSGKYSQDRGWLSTEKGHCCLGVGCEVLGLESVEVPARGEDPNHWKFQGLNGLTAETSAPWSLQNYLGLRDADGLFEVTEEIALLNVKASGAGHSSLTSLNDSGWTFQQIADFCEKYPHVVFKEEK